MFKHVIPLLLGTALLIGCSDNNNIPEHTTPQPPVTDVRLDNSYKVDRYPQAEASWYELNQYFNRVPKYSGVMGTYTAKHLPVAVSCNLGEWSVYSNNSKGYLEINVLNLNTGEVIPVRSLYHTTDPHQNAAINCINNKLVVYISARGDTYKGYKYESPDGYNWNLVSENDWSYPQIHNINNKEVVLYTNYSRKGNYVYRTPKSSCDNKPIIEDGVAHYIVSLEKDGVIHVIFNDMVKGADSRTNLGYTLSADGGCTWEKPIYWYKGNRVYLKDLNIINGKPKALVVIADSHKPETGVKTLYVIGEDNKEKIVDINHNYTTGALTEDGSVITPQGGTPYAGGRYGDVPHLNYIRRVLNSDRLVATEGIGSRVDSGAWIITLHKDKLQ